jgi:hypothetical protein
MGTYFIVYCHVKKSDRKWEEFWYGPYLTLKEACEIIDDVKYVSIKRVSKAKKTKLEIWEVMLTDNGQWENFRLCIEEAERFVNV